MNYYIQHTKQGPVIQCSRTKYYKVKREVITVSNETIILYEFKGKYFRHLLYSYI